MNLQLAFLLLLSSLYSPSAAVLAYQMPGLFMDVIFLTWIYLALGSTIRILTEFQQGYKLNLYKQLAFIIVLFVSLFAMASILILLDKYHFITWPVQFLWFQQVQDLWIMNEIDFISDALILSVVFCNFMLFDFTLFYAFTLYLTVQFLLLFLYKLIPHTMIRLRNHSNEKN